MCVQLHHSFIHSKKLYLGTITVQHEIFSEQTTILQYLNDDIHTNKFEH